MHSKQTKSCLNERTQIYWFVIASCAVSIAINCVIAQPQPRVEVDRDVWALLEFETGAQWYVRRAAVDVLHTVPEKDQQRLGYKTVIVARGTRITTPFTAQELKRHMQFIDVPPGRVTPPN